MRLRIKTNKLAGMAAKPKILTFKSKMAYLTLPLVSNSINYVPILYLHTVEATDSARYKQSSKLPMTNATRAQKDGRTEEQVAPRKVALHGIDTII